MNRYIKLLAFFLTVAALSSCDLGNEPDIDGTATRKMAGEWFLQLTDVDGSVSAYGLVTTANTAANLPSEMWLIDHSFFGAQFKISTDQSALTFSTTDNPNIEYSGSGDAPEGKPVVELDTKDTVSSDLPLTFTIANGKILQNAARPPSGTTTDSLFMQITANYNLDEYTAKSYEIIDVEGFPDTTVIWEKTQTFPGSKGIQILSGYRRTGFLEDEH